MKPFAFRLASGVIALALAIASAVAQVSIPAGTILPVQLNSSLRSDRDKVGQTVTARIMQDVKLNGREAINAGSTVCGRVVAVQTSKTRNDSRIVLRFDTVLWKHRHIHVTTNLRALANMMDIDEAQIPATGPDRGTDEFTWVTAQIGGETDYHGSVITNRLKVVGKSVPPTGALVEPGSGPRSPCRSTVDGNTRPQSTWVFASDACGLYGFPNLKLEHAGRSHPVGDIVLKSDHGRLAIRSGSGLLLRVD